MKWLLLIIAGGIIQLMLAELFAWFPWLAARLISRAANSLPEKSRTRYADEWLAELDAVPGLGLSQLLFACRVLLHAPATRLALASGAPRLRVLAVKRSFDIVLSVLILVLMAPVLAAIALAVKLNSHGPVLLREERIGFEGRPFQLLRFRTVTGEAGGCTREMDRLDWRDASTDGRLRESRCTMLDRLMRRCSLDELPQILNVLRGDMSLIGPRPMLTADVDVLDDRQKQRHQVRPGITGLWQVNRPYPPSLEEMIRIDLTYATKCSLRRDLLIMLETVRAAWHD